MGIKLSELFAAQCVDVEPDGPLGRLVIAECKRLESIERRREIANDSHPADVILLDDDSNVYWVGYRPHDRHFITTDICNRYRRTPFFYEALLLNTRAECQAVCNAFNDSHNTEAGQRAEPWPMPAE